MRLAAKVFFSELLKVVLFPLRLLPVRNNRILFTGLTGGISNEYSCNPMYVCEYLQEHFPGKYEIFWAVGNPEQYAELEKKGIHPVKHFALSSFPILMTAKVIVTNGSYAPWFPFRKKQCLINTWHGGGAYKKIENSKADAGWAARHRAEFCAKNISLFVSSCEKADEYLIRGAFLYNGTIMKCGTPRNDKLVRRETEEQSRKVRSYYGIAEDEKIVLYAPTYRPMEKELSLNSDRLLAELGKSGERYCLLYRGHRYQKAEELQITGERIVNASDYPDMQELLCAADMMITDYSSSVWDYSFLYRPCFLYVPDLNEYRKLNGFYVDVEDWPFALAQTEEELCRVIANYDETEAIRKIKEHHAYMGNYESGHACEEIAEYIRKVVGEQR